MAFTVIATGDPVLASVVMANFRHVNYGNALLPVDATGNGVNNSIPLGSTSYRFSNVYSVLGNFSGQITSSVSTGTAAFVVASTTKIVNLNADLLDDQTGSYYQNSDNQTAGTLPTGRLSGAYTGITSVGTLNASVLISLASGNDIIARFRQAGSGGSGGSKVIFQDGNTGTTDSDGLLVGLRSGSNAQIINQEAANLELGTNGTVGFTMDSSQNLTIVGSVSITTALNQLKLTTTGSGGSAEASLRFYSTNTGTGDTDGGFLGISGGANNMSLMNFEAANLSLGTNGTTGFTMDSSQNVKLYQNLSISADLLAWQSQYEVCQVGQGFSIACDTGVKSLYFNSYDTGSKFYAEGTAKYAARLYFAPADGSIFIEHTSASGNAGGSASFDVVSMTMTRAGNVTFAGDLTVTGGDITIGADCNLKRDSADVLKTDDTLIVAGDIATDEFQDWSGSASATGFSGTPTINYRYKKLGRLVFCSVLITGTSNGVSFTFTLPYEAVTSAGNSFRFPCAITDNSVDQTNAGRINIASAATSATVTKLLDGTAGTFTASGTKAVVGTFWYEASS